MRLPEIAERMREIAWDLPNDLRDELNALADEIKRRPAARGIRVSQTADEALRDVIREYARVHPGTPQMRIAALFNVNHGRVSEALRGFRS